MFGEVRVHSSEGPDSLTPPYLWLWNRCLGVPSARHPAITDCMQNSWRRRRECHGDEMHSSENGYLLVFAEPSVGLCGAVCLPMTDMQSMSPNRSSCPNLPAYRAAIS